MEIEWDYIYHTIVFICLPSFNVNFSYNLINKSQPKFLHTNIYFIMYIEISIDGP